MRIRRLQRRFESGEWLDDAYVYENADGQIIFRYNLTWGRIGARVNEQLKKLTAPFDVLEKIIPSNSNLRWLPIEIICIEEMDDYLNELDQACSIPNRQLMLQPLPA